MKKKIIRTIKDFESLKNGEVGIIKKGTFKWKILEEKSKSKRESTIS